MSEANKSNMGQMMAVTGTLLILARSSELHSGYRVAQLVDRCWPSIQRGHFCLYTDSESGKPVGFCNWLLVSQEVLDVLLSQERDVVAGDWDTGDIPFFPEMIAPFGHVRKVITDLVGHAMADVPWAYSLRGVMANADGTNPDQKVFKWKCGSSGTNESKSSGGKPNSPIRVI